MSGIEIRSEPEADRAPLTWSLGDRSKRYSLTALSEWELIFTDTLF